MNDYYNAKDVQQIIGCSQALAYQIIRKLKARFEKEYPDSIPILGRIPKWYFQEKMANKKGSE